MDPAAFLLMLREGVEAALIVGILLAYLAQLGRREDFKWVWGGTLAAVAVSLAAGWLIFSTVGELEGAVEEFVEGLIALAAAGLLTWMIFWMARQARFIKGQLHTQVDSALAAGGNVAVAAVAFVAVLREGLESALFLISTTVGEESVRAQLIGGLLGVAAAVGVGYLIYRGGRRLNLRVFFRVTGILLILFAAGLVAKGIHEFQEAGILPTFVEHLWTIEAADPQQSLFWRFASSLFGWDNDPSLLMVIGYFAYLIPVGWSFLRATAPAPRPLPEPAEEATAG